MDVGITGVGIAAVGIAVCPPKRACIIGFFACESPYWYSYCSLSWSF